jgi:hypothetical protein
VFAALITVSNVERGKKDRDEYAAELVTDGGSRDPLCQPHRHSETARSALRQQSTRGNKVRSNNKVYTRDTLLAAALSFIRKNPEISTLLDLSNSPRWPATATVRNLERSAEMHI